MQTVAASFGMEIPNGQPPLSTRMDNPNPPPRYTPPHLAERILAEQAAMEAQGSE